MSYGLLYHVCLEGSDALVALSIFHRGLVRVLEGVFNTLLYTAEMKSTRSRLKWPEQTDQPLNFGPRPHTGMVEVK
jgi:hypothetical protein